MSFAALRNDFMEAGDRKMETGNVELQAKECGANKISIPYEKQSPAIRGS
jgi:hypothetical protein